MAPPIFPVPSTATVVTTHLLSRLGVEELDLW